MGIPWLFGVGVSKSGGHSLAEALQLLGLSAYHFGQAANTDRGLMERASFAMEYDANPLRQSPHVDALIDYPVYRYWHRIATTHPSSKFILTYRPPGDCALSWCRQLSAEPHKVQDDWITTYSEFVSMCEQHVNAVLSAFRGQPERLLVLDMRDDSASLWLALCAFVDRPLPRPNVAFPHVFDHRERLHAGRYPSLEAVETSRPQDKGARSLLLEGLAGDQASGPDA